VLPSGWPTRGAPGAGRHPRHLRSASDYTILACMHACRPPPPPRIPSSGESLRGLQKRETGSGLQTNTSYGSLTLYINKGFPTLFNTPDTLCSHVPPPDRVYMYSLEIALRLAHIRKIHLYFSTHRPLSARCDPSRVSCIPPRARAATCIAPNAPRGPHSSMTTCRAVCLCDHVC
jgi:hypothetical protein